MIASPSPILHACELDACGVVGLWDAFLNTCNGAAREVPGPLEPDSQMEPPRDPSFGSLCCTRS